nr:unnamed protein product [Callosobruchus analis]
MTSSYDNGYSILKCLRFRCKQNSDATSSGCRCSSTQQKFKRLHSSVHCSTPNSISPFDNPLKSLIEKFNKGDIRNVTFHKALISEPGCARQNTSLKRDQNIFGSGSEGFIDDDYHSYTSSEELDSLAKIEEYEFNEVCKEFQKILDRKIFKPGKKDTDFETLVLEKLNSIENEIKEFKENVDELNKNVRQEDHADLQLMSMKDAQNYFGNQLSLVSKSKQSEVRGVIRKAIQRLCYDLNKKKREMVKQSKAKVMDLLQEIERGDADTDEHVKQLCIQVSKDLTTKVNGVLRANDIGNCNGASAILGEGERYRKVVWTWYRFCSIRRDVDDVPGTERFAEYRHWKPWSQKQMVDMLSTVRPSHLLEMDPLKVIIEDGCLSPLSFDYTQSTFIFPVSHAPVRVGSALFHELEDLAALDVTGDSDEDAEVDADEAVDNDDLDNLLSKKYRVNPMVINTEELLSSVTFQLL